MHCISASRTASISPRRELSARRSRPPAPSGASGTSASRPGVLRTAAGRCRVVQAERRERAGGLADGPLDRVEPIAAVGDVGHAQVLAGGQQVLDPPRDQGAERDLERQRADVDVVVAAGAGVQVDPVAADADAVGERLGRRRPRVPSALRRASVPTCCSSTVNSAWIRRDSRMYGAFARPSVGADQVGPQPQALPAGAAVGPGALGLQPVEQRQAQLLGPRDVPARPRSGVTPTRLPSQ